MTGLRTKMKPAVVVDITVSDCSSPVIVTSVGADFQARLRQSGRWMLACDLTALIAALIIGAVLAWGWRQLQGQDQFQDLAAPATLQQSVVYVALGFAGLLWLDSRGHYRQRLPFWEWVGHIFVVAAAGFVSSGFFEFAARTNSSRLWVGFSWILFAALMLLGRYAVRGLLDRAGAWQIPALVIGDGPTAAAALRALAQDRHMGFTITDRLPSSVLATMTKARAWQQVLTMHDAQHLFLALEGSDIEHHQAALKSLPRARVPCSIVPPWTGLPSSTLTPHHFMMNDVMLLHDTNRLRLAMPRLLKRATDIFLAGGALVCLSPVMLAVALRVRRDGSPAFFKQMRVGRHGRMFQCFKFRSMRADAEKVLQQHLASDTQAAAEWTQYQKLQNDVRVTRFGYFMRRTSLDELPQLINVLKGDMSLVGPRPCLPGQESFYAEDFSFYESVRPGITGPWQVSGRNRLTFKERVELEAWYARNWSLWLDLVIILKTFPTLLKRGQAF